MARSVIALMRKGNDGRYAGQLKTVGIKTSIDIVPDAKKSTDGQPDYRVLIQGIEIGAG